MGDGKKRYSHRGRGERTLYSRRGFAGLRREFLIYTRGRKDRKEKQELCNVFASFGCFGVKSIKAAVTGRNTVITRLSKSA
jgi:hypothetical protein